MTIVHFLDPQGRHLRDAEGRDGERLLDVAQVAGMPLEGTCEGQMACSTCHVILAPADFAALPKASEEEEDMLDFASHATRHSRLACQIRLGGTLTEITVRMPGGVHDMSG